MSRIDIELGQKQVSDDPDTVGNLATESVRSSAYMEKHRRNQTDKSE